MRVLRLDPPAPGQEAQVDYGQLGRWTDPATGRRHVVNAFAMVLCCSRLLFVRPVIKMDQGAWTECHAAAFAFFGGVPATRHRHPQASRAPPHRSRVPPPRPRRHTDPWSPSD